MSPYERFHELLKQDFAPLLRADGFKGSGSTFRRVVGERFDVINVQGSRSGGQCCVNVAVHFTFLPMASGSLVTDVKKLMEYHCSFRSRLHEVTESDHWWKYGETELEAKNSIADLVGMYERRGAAFFGMFEPFPNVFEKITPEQLEAGDLTKMPSGGTVVSVALTLARIMRHLDRRKSCREFAEVGLRHLGRAVGLLTELEQLRDWADLR